MKLLKPNDAPTRVRALTSSAGNAPFTTFVRDEILEVPKWRAAQLLAAGVAELVADDVPLGVPPRVAACVRCGAPPLLAHQFCAACLGMLRGRR
jgi:hypothetical protein